MTQTLSEKLRIIADAVEAGETHIAISDHPGNRIIQQAIDWVHIRELVISRIPAQIKVGNRTINAPLRVMPKEGSSYWIADDDYVGHILEEKWDSGLTDLHRLENANCWATEADAKAYAEASLAVRKGEV